MPTANELPLRYRAARIHRAHLDLPAEWLGEMGRWLHAHRDAMQAMAPGEWWHTEIAYEGIPTLRAAVAALAEEAVAACLPGVGGEWQVGDVQARLHHHRSEGHWCAMDGGHDPCAVAWELVLHSQPKLFGGGQLEWSDGTTAPAEHGHITFFDPRVRHRVAPVECWSAQAIDGRWSLVGTLYRPLGGGRTHDDPQPTAQADSAAGAAGGPDDGLHDPELD